MTRIKKATLFVRCSQDEAARIRQAPKWERRTVSGFILNAVQNRIEAREKLPPEQLRFRERATT